jgi:hypothetical protein
MAKLECGEGIAQNVQWSRPGDRVKPDAVNSSLFSAEFTGNYPCGYGE